MTKTGFLLGTLIGAATASITHYYLHLKNSGKELRE